MIFVTVGTHEQQFDRLIMEIDRLKSVGSVDQEVFIQSGYTTYKPRHCEFAKSLSYESMNALTREADVVITHGGPGSIMLSLSMGKIPIVVPRQSKFFEHVDDHQVKFVRRLERENKILAVYDIAKLEGYIHNHEFLASSVVDEYGRSNLIHFVNRLDRIAETLVDA